MILQKLAITEKLLEVTQESKPVHEVAWSVFVALEPVSHNLLFISFCCKKDLQRVVEFKQGIKTNLN